MARIEGSLRVPTVLVVAQIQDPDFRSWAEVHSEQVAEINRQEELQARHQALWDLLKTEAAAKPPRAARHHPRRVTAKDQAARAADRLA